jgi:hypothetical protein
MPMATDRRRFLLAAASAVGASAAAAARQAHSPIAAAWHDGADAAMLGRLVKPLGSKVWELHSAQRLPTRAHALLAEPAGSLLAVARRPGDWLGRFDARLRPLRTAWAAPGRAFNGHALRAGERLFTTETDLETGAGFVVWRDADTLKPRALWSSHGRDPHDLAIDADGRLWVANGGIETLPETGRLKRVGAMDSSLVCLDARDGRRFGQWRLADARLSLRHLAISGRRGGAWRIGVALQAEHDDAEVRGSAPLLALWEHGALALPAAAPRAHGGYAGDVASDAAGGFWIGAPRGDALLHCGPAGELLAAQPLRAACGVAAAGGWIACTATDQLAAGVIAQSATAAASAGLPAGARFDNHLAWWPGHMPE